MGVMVIMMLALLAFVPGHMGLDGHQHGQGSTISRPADLPPGAAGSGDSAAAPDEGAHRH